MIDALRTANPGLAREFELAKNTAEAQSRFMRASGRFPLTAVGDVNTYALFAELVRSLLASTGRAGVIVPVGIATDDTTKRFFGDLVNKQALARIVGFENEAFIFPAVHNEFKFCIFVVVGDQKDRLQRVRLLLSLLRARASAGTKLSPIHRRSLPPKPEYTHMSYLPHRSRCRTYKGFLSPPTSIGGTKAPKKTCGSFDSLAMFHMSGDSGDFRTQRYLAE